MENKKLDGVKAIAQYLNLTESSVMALILRQDLPAKRDDKTATYSAQSKDIEKWLNAGKKATSKKPGESPSTTAGSGAAKKAAPEKEPAKSGESKAAGGKVKVK